ncbi:MAG: YceI family protein [Ignavibacteriaceae bacterium]
MKKILLVLPFLIVSICKAQVLTVDHSNTNIVRFYAEATFNSFEGTTDAIDGKIVLGSRNSLKQSSVELIVLLDSLDTGNGLRNSHMLDSYLETKKYPTAKFSGQIISLDSLSSSEYHIKTSGVFTLHGVSKPMTVEGNLFSYGKLLKLESTFFIELSDFNIKQPSFFFNTVKEKIKVYLAVYFDR